MGDFSSRFDCMDSIDSMSHLESSANRSGPGSLLRVRDGHEARVTFVELFFDLVYVFCITQLSHYLLHELSLWGALALATPLAEAPLLPSMLRELMVIVSYSLNT